MFAAVAAAVAVGGGDGASGVVLAVNVMFSVRSYGSIARQGKSFVYVERLIFNTPLGFSRIQVYCI